MMKPKIIIDSENEHIVRYWDNDLKQIMFEVIISANYTIYHLEVLIRIFNREINNARNERKKEIKNNERK